MKKIFTLILSIVALASLAGCGGGSGYDPCRGGGQAPPPPCEHGGYHA